MLELTDSLQRALDARLENPLRVRDPRTGDTYVLLRAELYEHLKDLLDGGPLTGEERSAIIRGVWEHAGWDDLEMDEYDALPPPA